MSDSIMDSAEIIPNTTEYGEYSEGARIKVIGVGGGGGNAIQHMIDSGLYGVQFITANTDRQALNRNSAEIKIQIGEKLTKGRGAGANPRIGRDAAMESVNAIRDAIGDAEMLFVTAGMGGGTGTGGAPVVAQVAKEMGVLTVGVVTKPFDFEGARRKKVAEDGLSELKQHVDCLITIPNDRLLSIAPKKASFLEMFGKSNEVLYHAVKGISDVVNAEGLLNLDFADVRTTMAESGMALMGTGLGTGENRAREAALKAISSPLLEDVSLDSAKAILYNITASRDISIDEVHEIGKIIHDAAPEDCNIIFGVVFDDNIGDDLSITIIATGIEPYEESLAPVDTLAPTLDQNKNILQDQDVYNSRETSRSKITSLQNDLNVDNDMWEQFSGSPDDRPAYLNNQQRRSRDSGRYQRNSNRFSNLDNENLPIFLRRQAD